MKKIVLCIVGIYSFTLLSARTSADSLIAERKDSLRISATSNFSGRLDRFSSSHFYQCNLQIFLCLFLEKLNMPQNTPVTKAS